METEWISVKDRLPESLKNILVAHTVHNQHFTTRAYLSASGWHVMTWGGPKIVPFSDIKFWTNLPNEPKI
jgi:hypothetical protein